MFARLFFILSLQFFGFSLFSQLNADEILGYYMSPDESSIFKFYKSGNKYFGKSVWMKRPSRLDTLNPDVSKRTQKILGSVLVWDFIYDGKNNWSKGYVYDANKGKIYKSKITRDEKGNLIVRGFIGVTVIGKTEYFVKVDFKEPEQKNHESK